ncbi:MAG: DUF4294 domain-containing protein [Prevotella sp.]|nr:DUF4294 domain-containing protein [Prevotella sp.]
MKKTLALFALLALLPLAVAAQVSSVAPEDKEVDVENPLFVPSTELKRTILDGDSALLMDLGNVYVYPVMELKSEKQRRAFNRLVANVKKVLPMAKETNKIIIETYEYLQTLPDDKARDAHMKKVEAEIYNTYKPRMKKLTYSQGKLLIKLVNRECNSSSYDIVKAFMGPIRAGFWQAFAWTFGASLKKKYKPETTDRITERVVLMVEAGQL